MTQYNTLSINVTNSQFNHLKSGIKNNTRFHPMSLGDSNDENNFLQKFLITNTQFPRLRKDFENNSSANIKSSKTQLHQIGESGGFLGRLLGQLIKTGIWNVLKPLAKIVLVPLGLTAAASATDAAFHKKMFESGMTTLIISNEKMNNIVKIDKSLEEPGLLIKGVSEIIKNEAKKRKGRFLSILLGILGASLLENLLTGKVTIKVSKRTIRAGEKFYCRLIL